MRHKPSLGSRLLAPARAWANKERGASEVAAAIFVIPLMIALIFTLIEVGFNLHYRTQVDNVAQDAVRGVSHDGAVYDPRTYTGPRGERYEQDGAGWQTWGQERLTQLCGSARCKQPPTITCSPSTLQTYAGETATCRVRFWYSPITGRLLDNPIMNLGFGGLWSDPIEVEVTTVTTVGSGL